MGGWVGRGSDRGRGKGLGRKEEERRRDGSGLYICVFGFLCISIFFL